MKLILILNISRYVAKIVSRIILNHIRNIPVFIDGAHALGSLPLSLRYLNQTNGGSYCWINLHVQDCYLWRAT